MPLIKPDAPRGQLRLRQLGLQTGTLAAARQHRIEHLPADAAAAAGGVDGKVLEKDKVVKIPRRDERLHASVRRAQDVNTVRAVGKQRALPGRAAPLRCRKALCQQAVDRVKVRRLHPLYVHVSSSCVISPRSR